MGSPRKVEAAPAARSSPAEVVPLTAELARVHVTLSRAFLDKVEAARDALSHSHPNASMEEVLEAGLDLLLARSARRKGLVEKPRKTPPASKGDAIPAHAKRAVMLRDGGRCQSKLHGGGICGSTRQIEFDHVEEKARGGPPTVENVRLLCRFHNQLKARLVFGDAWMDRFSRKDRRARSRAFSAGGDGR
ncbi:MAG TPA: HNH endonuclease signature motif containing protein [Anaeromyxobacteraceae bacterium]|nr:HNH endonuclease signature motif containing protein [Anaeromyxobacteraceae bacterium]